MRRRASASPSRPQPRGSAASAAPRRVRDSAAAPPAAPGKAGEGTSPAAAASARVKVTRSGAMSASVLEAKGCVDYVDAIGTAVAHRVRSAPEPTGPGPRTRLESGPSALPSPRPVPLSLSLAGCSGGEGSGGGGGGGAAGNPADALWLIYRAANGLLHWFHALELRRPQDGEMNIADAHRNVALLGQELAQAVSVLQGELAGSVDGAVAQYIAMNARVFDDCRAAIEQLFATATTLAAVRNAVQTRDVKRAQELVANAAAAGGGKGRALLVPPERQAAGAARGRVPVRSQAAASGSALATAAAGGSGGGSSGLLMWLERQWIPAMLEWQRLRERSAEAASRSRSSTDVDAAMGAVQAEVISRSSSIAEILLPGESLSQLVEKEIARPLEQRSEHLREREAAFGRLRAAVAASDYNTLSANLRSAQRFGDLAPDEAELCARAERLLLDVQRVAKVTVRFTSTQHSRDALAVAAAVHEANVLMEAMGLFIDASRCRAAVAYGERVLQQGAETRVGVISPAELIVEHVPDGAWAAELTEIYARALEHLTTLVNIARITTMVSETAAAIRSSAALDAESASASSATICLQSARELAAQAAALGVGGEDLRELDCFIRDADELPLKIHFNSNIRLTSLPGGRAMSFEEARARLAGFCGVQPSSPSSSGGLEGFRVRYQDVDGDHISVLTDDDWRLMLRDCHRCTRSNRLELYCVVQAVPTTPTRESAAPAPVQRAVGGTPQKQQQQQQHNVAGVHQASRKGPGDVPVCMQVLGLSPGSHKPPTPHLDNLHGRKTSLQQVKSSDTGTSAAHAQLSSAPDRLAVVDLEPPVAAPRVSRWELESNVDLRTVASTETADVRGRHAEDARRHALARLDAHQRKQDENRHEVVKSMQLLQQMRGAHPIRSKASQGPAQAQAQAQASTSLAVVGRGKQHGEVRH